MAKKEKIEETIIEEYDEDLEELMDDEIEEYVVSTNTNDNKEITFSNLLDEKIEKNISSFMIFSSITKWLMFIIAFIFFILGISSGDEPILGILLMSLLFIFLGFIYSLFLKWFGLTLKCLYDIKNSK